jgi:hypothetical protein
MKTDVEIRQDVFAVVKESAIALNIKGEVRYIPRKGGSASEDCIISVLDGYNGQIQKCIVNVNVYVPNIDSDGESVEDITRTKLLAKVCETALECVYGDGFIIRLEKQRIMPVNGKDEHVINNRIRYNFNNE